MSKRAIVPVFARLEAWMIARPHPRQIYNSVYEMGDPRIAWVVTRLGRRPTEFEPFLWKAKLPPGELLLPMSPEFGRSWANALLWQWPPNLPMRRLYADYTAHRGQTRTAPGSEPQLFLDVGANDGMHSAFFAVAGWDCVAFEPQATCLEYIARMIDANRFVTVRIERCVVGDQEVQDVEFFSSASTWYSSLSRQSVERFEVANAERIRMITLDSYCKRRGLLPTCIKIDVEGHELSVLRGAHQVISSAKPDLVIEVSADDRVRGSIWDLLEPLGYRGYVLPTHWRSGLRAVTERAAFIADSPSAPHLDTVFTVDEGLQRRFESG